MKRDHRRGIASFVAIGTLLCASEAALAAEGPVTPSAGPKVVLKPCERPGVPEGARCGTLEVYENRETGTGRRIPLSVLVLPATGQERRPEALVHLAGGPGDSSVRAAGWVAEEFSAVRSHRDLLFVDQRGTGASHPLHFEAYDPAGGLQAYLGDFLPAEAVRRGRAELEKVADLTRYTTSVAADDLDEVRAALGYERLDLFGASYGTRLALEYARRHPDRTRTLILAGVNSPSDLLPLPQPRSAQEAIDGLARQCASDPGCRRAFPGFRAEFDAVLERLARQPAETPVLDPRTGDVTRVTLSRAVAAEAVRYMMYSPATAAQVPALVHAAAGGDLTPLAEMALFGRMQIVAGTGGLGTFLSVLCSEDIPWIRPEEMARAAAGSYWGTTRYDQLRAACQAWPRAPVPATFTEPVASDVPALLLNGELDPATGPDMARRAAGHLRRSLVVVVPEGSHWFEGMTNAACVGKLMTDFVDRGSVEGLDPGCAATIRRTPFTLEAPQLAVVRLPDEVLRGYAGRFRGEEAPFEVSLEVVKDKLRLTMPDGRQMLLAAVSRTRFRLVGAPGLFFDFELDGGSVRRVTMGKGTPEELALAPVKK